MTEQEHIILDCVLRGESFICCQDGYAYFLGPEASTLLIWQDAMDWCKSLGDGHELPSKEILNECYENESIREEFKQKWYWSSTVHDEYTYYFWGQSTLTGNQFYDCKTDTNYARAVRRVAI